MGWNRAFWKSLSFGWMKDNGIAYASDGPANVPILAIWSLRLDALYEPRHGQPFVAVMVLEMVGQFGHQFMIDERLIISSVCL